MAREITRRSWRARARERERKVGGEQGVSSVESAEEISQLQADFITIFLIASLTDSSCHPAEPLAAGLEILIAVSQFTRKFPASRIVRSLVCVNALARSNNVIYSRRVRRAENRGDASRLSCNLGICKLFFGARFAINTL